MIQDAAEAGLEIRDCTEANAGHRVKLDAIIRTARISQTARRVSRIRLWPCFPLIIFVEAVTMFANNLLTPLTAIAFFRSTLNCMTSLHGRTGAISEKAYHVSSSWYCNAGPAL